MGNRSQPDIEAAVALAEAQTGIRSKQTFMPMISSPVKSKPPKWTEAEDEYLRENLGRQSHQAIAQHLNRSALGIKLHAERDLHLKVASKADDILTAEHISMGIDVDGHSIKRLIDRGLLPARRLPMVRTVRVVDRLALLAWLLDPAHWCYFKPERVGAMTRNGLRGFGGTYDLVFWEEARTAVLKAKAAWKDAWLTPGEAARHLDKKHYHGINAAIRKGHLKATRWGNWWIRRSDLPVGLVFNALGYQVREILPKGKRHGPTGPQKNPYRRRRRRHIAPRP